jgi:hypothetical protein
MHVYTDYAISNTIPLLTVYTTVRKIKSEAGPLRAIDSRKLLPDTPVNVTLVARPLLRPVALKLCWWEYGVLTSRTYCNVLGVLYSQWNFIALQKSLQLNIAGNSWNTRTRPTRTVSEH